MRKINIIYLTFIFILISNLSKAQSSFYETDSLKEIRIYFYEPNWQSTLDSLYIIGNDERTFAYLVIDGEQYDSVGIRYKGFSSVSVNTIKNPLNIKIDYVKGKQDLDGYRKIKLANSIYDPSFLREVLSYEIARKYMPAPKANFANVFINDTLWGLYTNVEAINRDFVSTNFGERHNPFFKCEPDNLDISIGGENSNLSDSHGNDSTDYYDYYRLESLYGWSQLYGLIDTLNNFPNSLDNNLNIDRTLWMHAFNYVLVNFDSYIGYSQNYYLYRELTNQFSPLVWDLNMSFGGFRLTDASALYFNGFSIPQAQNMDPFVHHNNMSLSPRPLMRNLFASERNRKMYLAHIRTIVSENFTNQSYINRANQMRSLIDAHVQNDTNKFYTYSDFLSNLNNSVSLVNGDCPGITQLMSSRENYLSNYAGYNGHPDITNVNYPTNYNLGDDIFINATVSNVDSVFLNFRFGDNMKFTSITMLDDGNNNDGLPNDGIFGAKISNTCNKIDFYVYAENNIAGEFSPARAAFEYYSVNVNLPVSGIVINELMSNNVSAVEDPAGETDDWIELYNSTSFYINVEDLFLSDTSTNLFKWQLPSIAIKPYGYYIIWADEQKQEGFNHANFRLFNFGEKITLSNSSGVILDSITIAPQPADIAFARSPNGFGSFVLQPHTFNRSNNLLTNNNEIIKEKIQIFPNPSNKYLNFSQKSNFTIFDMFYREVMKGKNTDFISIETLNKGTYFIRISNTDQIVKLIKI